MTSLILTHRSPLEAIRAALASDPYIKSDHTKRQYLADLTAFETWRTDQPLTKTLVEAYMAHLQTRKLAPATINQHLASIRWWARKVADLAADHANDATAALIEKQAARVLTVRGLTNDPLPAGRYVPQSEFDRLLAACDRDPSPAGHRDGALLAVAWATGRRREELASICVTGIKQESETHWILTFRGTKGDRDLTSDIYAGTINRLRLWFDRRGYHPTGYIFPPILKSGKILFERKLSGEALRKILLGRWQEAKIEKPITWHDFRRTLTSNLIDDSDTVVAQKTLGHRDVATTARYDRRPDETRQAALRRVVQIPK